MHHPVSSYSNRSEFTERDIIFDNFFNYNTIDLVKEVLGEKYYKVIKEKKLYQKAEEYFYQTDKFRLDNRNAVQFVENILKGELIERFAIAYFKSIHNRDLVFNKTEISEGQDLIIVDNKHFLSNETDLKVQGTDIGIEIEYERYSKCLKDGYVFQRGNKLPNLIKRSKTKKTFIVLFILEAREMRIIEITPDMKDNLVKDNKYNKSGYRLDLSNSLEYKLKNINNELLDSIPVHDEEKGKDTFVYKFINKVLDKVSGEVVEEVIEKIEYV